MLRLLLPIVALLALTSDALALSQLSARKVYGREIFTSADKNADETYTFDAINEVRAFFPGTDSLKITRVVTDTLHARTASNLTVISRDTLRATNTHFTAIRGDSLKGDIGSNTSPTLDTLRVTNLHTIFSSGSSWSTRLDSLDYLHADSIAVDSLTVANKAEFLGAMDVAGALTATGLITANGGFTSAIGATFSGGLTAQTLSSDATTETTSGTTGAIHTDGGLGVAKDIYLGDDLLIATGGVLNWNADNVTLTHSDKKLTMLTAGETNFVIQSAESEDALVEFRGDGTGTEYSIGRVDGGDEDKFCIGVAGGTNYIWMDSSGNLGVKNSSPGAALDVTGAALISSTLGVTGVATFTTTISAATGSTIGDLTLANGSITSSGAAIDFGAENLSTTGTLGAGATTVTDLTSTGNTTIGNATGDALTFHPSAWTLTNAVTITGTWTDLGIVTTADINGGTLDGVTIGGATPAAATVTTLNTTGAVVHNEAGADLDFRVAATGATNALFVQGSDGAVGIGTASPSARLHVIGVDAVTAIFGTAVSEALEVWPGSSNAGPALMYDDASAIRFGTHSAFGSAGWSEKMRLDASGNLGLGVTPEAAPYAPFTGLHVGGTSYIASETTAAAGAQLWLGQNVTSDTDGNSEYVVNDEASLIQMKDGQILAFTAAASTGDIAWGTAKLTIDNAGQLDSRGDVAAGYQAFFFNDGNNANRYGIEVQAGADDASGDTYYLNCKDGDGGSVGYIWNTSTTFQLVDASDRRIKDSIVDTELEGIETIKKLKVRDFNKFGHPVKAGFVAQEVAQVFPKAAAGDSTATRMVITPDTTDMRPIITQRLKEEITEYILGDSTVVSDTMVVAIPDTTYEARQDTTIEPVMMGVAYSAFVPLNVKAIQEQQEIIEYQNQRIANLEATVADLVKRVTKLEK